MFFARPLQVLFLILTLTVSPFTAHATGSADGARDFVQQVGEQGLDAIKNGGSDQQKRVKLEQLFIANVDIPWIGKFVLGKHWREAAPEQQKAYLQNYQTFLVKHYTKNFTDYTGGTFKVKGAHEEQAGEYLVSMDIIRPGEEAIGVDYRIRQNGGSYKVYDIIVEGVSLITTQRSEFASVVSRKGLDYLVEQLKNKSATEDTLVSGE